MADRTERLGETEATDRVARDRLFNLIALLLYVVITVTVALRHEPWRDEADSWLLVRDAGITEVIGRMAYTGTPALWYLVIFPLARLGLPFVAQTFANLIIMSLAAFVWLRSAPFSRTFRMVALFCFPLAYEYPVVARSYGLSVLLLFLFLANYCDNKRPVIAGTLLALLANTNVPSAIMAVLLMGVLFVERRDRYHGGRGVRIAGAIFAAGLLLAILQVNPAPDANVGATIATGQHPSFWAAIGGAFWPHSRPVVSGFIGAAILAKAVFALRRKPMAVVYLLLSVASLSLLFSLVLANGPRHFGFIFLATLAALWIGAPSAEDVDRTWHLSELAIAVLLVFSVATSVKWWSLDIARPFSGAREMAAYIQDHVPQSTPIAAHFPVYAESVLPYLGDHRQFWYPALGEYGSYMKWDSAYESSLDVGYRQAELATRKKFGSAPHLLLLAAEMPDPAASGYRLLFSSQPGFAHPEERYWLYAPSTLR